MVAKDTAHLTWLRGKTAAGSHEQEVLPMYMDHRLWLYRRSSRPNRGTSSPTPPQRALEPEAQQEVWLLEEMFDQPSYSRRSAFWRRVFHKAAYVALAVIVAAAVAFEVLIFAVQLNK